MEVTQLAVYQVELPVADGTYDWSGENSYEAFDSTILELRTDSGYTGWGEATTLGSSYLPAFARGVRAGLEELAGTVLKSDPTQPAVVADRLDHRLKGSRASKSAVDMACWDLAGQAVGRPVAELLGGRFGEPVPLYRAISQDSPEQMAEQVARYRDRGYDTFQLKIGDNPTTDAERIRAARGELDATHTLDADANGGLTRREAVQLANLIRDVDVYLEQPCESYEACLAVRRRTALPFVLDECIDGLQPVVRGAGDGAMDAVNLKLAKVGGLTRARAIRDLCAALGFEMIIEDTWGSEIATAAIAHLAHSTPPEARLAATDFHNYNSIATATDAPSVREGQMTAPLEPGLGVSPEMETLGDPVMIFQ